MLVICKTWIPLHQRMLCAKFRWNWPCGSGEKACQISLMYSRFFVIISVWKIAWPFIWTNLKSPITKDALCQAWFLRRRFLNFVNVFSNYFRIIFPWKMASPFICRGSHSLYPRMLCAKFGWNWLNGSWENVKSLQMDRRTKRRKTDNSWSKKLTWAEIQVS